MTRWTALLVACLLAISLGGCAAHRHLNAGDAAAAGGDMRGALHHYQRALGHKQSLARDAEFTAKLATAESRVAYEEAVRLRELGRYEPAIEQLRRSIDRDASYEAAKQLLPAVRAEAGNWRVERALSAADGGDLAQARIELERALQHDLTNEDAASAMASLSIDRLPNGTAGLDAYREGVSRSAERRWAQAEQSFASAIGLNGRLLPARAGLHEARHMLAESRAQASKGRSSLSERRIGPAIEQFTLALSVWPYNEPAADGLATAQHQRGLADERFDTATDHAAARRWDDAIAQADAGLAVDRSHPGLRELRGKLAGRAASDYSQQGDAHRAVGELDDAKQAYNRALGYANNYRDAQRGLAEVYRAWGAADEAADRHGAALLHYGKARGIHASSAADGDYARVLSDLRRRIGMGLGVSVTPAERGGAVPAGLLEHALVDQLSPYQSAGLSLSSREPAYRMAVTIRGATIDQRLTATADRTFGYTTREWRHNPEHDRVARRLEREIATYDRYCRDYERTTGRGHAGHHGHEHDAHASHQYNRIVRQQRTVDHWKEQLACTPRQIQVNVRRTWPYTLETHTKLGRLSALVELIDTSSGEVIERLTPDTTYSASDDTILNANPTIGLHPDALRLPSDGEAREVLAIKLAEAAAPEGLHLAVQHRLSAIAAEATALRERGEHPAALEHEVDVAVLLRLVDPEASAKLLGDLTQRHTR